MQKSDVFFKDFKTSFIVAGLAFTVFFAMAIFFFRISYGRNIKN